MGTMFVSVQCNQEVQKQLFGRVAVNYVKLLCELIEERWRDVFFKVRSEQVDGIFYV